MASSFSGNVKSEMCKVFPQKHCCALAECFGILLYCNCFQADCIRIITECRELGKRLPKLFRKAFGVEFDSLPSESPTGKLVFQITRPEKIRLIMESYGFDPADTLMLYVNLPVVEEECCKTAFLRGAFLTGGSVTDPEKGYHLEINTTHMNVSAETNALLQEVLGFYFKPVKRGGGNILYLKQSDKICDFLTCLGAPVSAMGVIEAKLEKELKNKVNRRCNCDDANPSKVVEAAQEQIGAITLLRESGVLEHLPQKLQQAAIARENHPSASLTELAALMEPPISKPAMNHRLKKLAEAAKEAVK